MVNNPDYPDLSYSCKLLSENTQLPVFYTKEGHAVETIWGSRDQHNPFFMEFEKLVRPFIEKEMEYPVILTANSWEDFIIVPVKRHGERSGFVVIGPSVRQATTEEHILGLMNDNHLSYRDLPNWKAYWDSLPVVSHLRLHQIIALAHWMINQETLEITDVLQYSYQSVLPAMFKENIAIEVSTSRELSVSNHSLKIRDQLEELIRTGNTTELIKQWVAIPTEGIGVLSKRSQLRNAKNLAICCIMLATGAAIEGGLYEDLALTLSDLHIQQIEDLNEVKAVEAAMASVVWDFTERVKQSRNEKMSKPVRVCCEYIYSHLYQEITIDKLTELTGLNDSYLMNLFKKQTGMTLMNYVQKQRVEEAMELLRITNDTVSSIGLRLNFSDQSHFIKVFKKFTGITPKKYRSTLITEG
ncbi:MAG TPA: helix-turn-helix domain-containing protein [Paenibacillus sp.]